VEVSSGRGAPKKGFLANQWVRYGIAFILGLVLGGVAVGAGDGEPTTVAADTPTATPTPTGLTSPEPEPEPEPEPTGDLTASNIELSLKTTEKQCFGSAGCNVSVEVRVAVDEFVVDALDPSGTWDVTYRISGDESGPIIGTLSVYGDGQYDVNEEFLSTRSSNTPVNIEIVSVDEFYTVLTWSDPLLLGAVRPTFRAQRLGVPPPHVARIRLRGNACRREGGIGGLTSGVLSRARGLRRSLNAQHLPGLGLVR
jgi:hypothetical protein